MRRFKGTTREPKWLQVPLFIFFLHAFSSAAVACTLCHTETGKQVRAGIFGPDFIFNLTVTIVPFVIFLAITALIYFGAPTRWNGLKVANRRVSTAGICPKVEAS